jgi:CheY-like chemotaxis protein
MSKKEKEKLTILIVEDESSFRRILRFKLSEDGYNVLEASDGIEGLEQVRSQKIDLILLDLVMPNMDGFDFLEEFTKDDKIPKIPIIVLSNLCKREDMEKATEYGIVNYMVKINYSVEDVVNKVGEYVISD